MKLDVVIHSEYRAVLPGLDFSINCSSQQSFELIFKGSSGFQKQSRWEMLFLPLRLVHVVSLVRLQKWEKGMETQNLRATQE